jgi:hypothetical protein
MLKSLCIYAPAQSPLAINGIKNWQLSRNSWHSGKDDTQSIVADLVVKMIHIRMSKSILNGTSNGVYNAKKRVGPKNLTVTYNQRSLYPGLEFEGHASLSESPASFK